MPAITAQGVREGIDTGNRNFMTAVQAGDAAAMAALFTADALLLPPNGDFVSGTQAIQAFYEAALGVGIRAAVIETMNVESHGETAIEMGKYTLTGDGGAVLDHGKYIVVWKHDGNGWRLHHDIWNSSQAPG